MSSDYKKIYAVDFDGTLAVTKFPEIIELITPMIELCKRLQNDGNTIILHTCRSGEDLEAAVKFCKGQGLTFDYINENIPENIERFGNDSRKIFAHVYIDDKSWNPEHEESEEARYLRTWQEFEEARHDLAQEIVSAIQAVVDPLAKQINKYMEKFERLFKEGKE